MTGNNENIRKFADEVSKIVEMPITEEHVHASEGRYYYIQPPKVGAPMILNHYRGAFFIDIHPDDYRKIFFGEISTNDYIQSANWQIGYYWGGYSMIGGGYYQPIDLIGRQEEVRRYVKILFCRGRWHATGYMPNEVRCSYCTVKNCPFNQYNTEGNWDNELTENDPRKDLLEALVRRFEWKFPGYTIKGFLCGKIPNNEVWFRPNFHYSVQDEFSFTAYVSQSVIQELLMRENIPEDWDNYAGSFRMKAISMLGDLKYAATRENLARVSEKIETWTNPQDVWEEKVPLVTRVLSYLKRKILL